MRTCKGKDKKLVDKQWKENAQRAYERGMEPINMMDMASVACEKANTQIKGQTSKKAHKRWCPRGTNVGLDRMSITSLC